MKYAEFHNFPLTDVVKITYGQWLLNSYTKYVDSIIKKATNKHSRCAHICTIFSVLYSPLVLLLMPVAVMYERRNTLKLAERSVR